MNLNSVVSCQNFYDFLVTENYTYPIYIPTRVTPTSATCPDHIYVSFLENFCCVPILMGRISNVSNYSFRNLSEGNILALRIELSTQLKIFNIFDEVDLNQKINICFQKMSGYNQNYGNSEPI